MSKKHPLPFSRTDWLPALALAAATLLLSSCGGGDSSTPEVVAAPQVQITVVPAEVTVGQAATLTWTATNADSCVASGAWTGPQQDSGSITLTQAAGTQPFRLDCTGPGGKASASTTLAVLAPAAPPGANTMQVTVDRGPNGDNFDTAFVSVTVCIPGTATCRTVDHVMVDTGSVGLRLMAAALDIAPALPAVNTAGGSPAGSCGQFVSGFTWGAVRRADVRLGGATAASLPLQVISDPAAPYATIPSSCRSIGFNQGTPAALGANGILGVGFGAQDCSTRCVASTAQRAYYACPTTGCVTSAMPLESQIANPVSFLAGNSNGLSLALPAVPPGGTRTLTGTLTFGIGTQANNQLGAATVMPTDSRGNFTTLYKGRSYTRAFIDSGSNGILFDDTEIPLCGDFYCPPSPLQLTATNVSPAGPRVEVGFRVENINLLASPTAAWHAAGWYGASQTFDWGLPFFFGRTVFMAHDGEKTPAGAGPFWAY